MLKLKTHSVFHDLFLNFHLFEQQIGLLLLEEIFLSD